MRNSCFAHCQVCTNRSLLSPSEASAEIPCIGAQGSDNNASNVCGIRFQRIYSSALIQTAIHEYMCVLNQCLCACRLFQDVSQAPGPVADGLGRLKPLRRHCSFGAHLHVPYLWEMLGDVRTPCPFLFRVSHGSRPKQLSVCGWRKDFNRRICQL